MNGERELPQFLTSLLGEEDGSYRRRSRTPPSESFSYDEDYHHRCRNKNSSSKDLRNDAMSRVLYQISRSPFTRKIEGGRLYWWFTKPTFTIYNGRTDLWSMFAISIKEWLCTPRTKSWCAKYSHLAWGLWRWGGMIVWVQVSLVPLRNSLRCLDPISSRATRFLNP